MASDSVVAADGAEEHQTRRSAGGGSAPEAHVAVPWGQLPTGAWSLVGSFLSDRSASRGAAAAPLLRVHLASPEAWAQRAVGAWARFSCLSRDQRQVLNEASASQGPCGYTTRRSLLRRRSVAIFSGRNDKAAALAGLVRHLGAASVAMSCRPGEGSADEADLVLVEQGGHGRSAPRSWRWRLSRRRASPAPTVLAARWLQASCVAGRCLPAHRPGCPSEGSAFSLPRSCIACPRHAAIGAELCCFAPRILEGCLVSSSRVDDQDFLAATVRALGGKYTDELTPLHSHLIAGEGRQGLKVELARASGIPVVSRSWLTMTHRHETPMQERCFAVG